MSVPSGLPCEPSGSCRGKKPGTAASLVQGQPKRNMAMASAEARKNLGKESQERFKRGDPLPRVESPGHAGLFDRHDQPPDQPRDFVQTVAVVIPHGLRKPNEALVVAHLGYFARND